MARAIIKSGWPITAALIAVLLVFFYILLSFVRQDDFYDIYDFSRLRSARWSILFMPEQQSWTTKSL